MGDIIKEVNGQPVGSDSSRALQELLRSASGSVILKILPRLPGAPICPARWAPAPSSDPQHKTQGVAEPPTRQGHRPRGGRAAPLQSVCSEQEGRDLADPATYRSVHLVNTLACLPWS